MSQPEQVLLLLGADLRRYMCDSSGDGNAHVALSASFHTAMCNRLGFRQCRHPFACRVTLMRVLLRIALQ
jgi:hypothetical protein